MTQRERVFATQVSQPVYNPYKLFSDLQLCVEVTYPHTDIHRGRENHHERYSQIHLGRLVLNLDAHEDTTRK